MAMDALPLRRPAVWRESQRPGLGTALFGIALIAFGVGLGILTLVSERSPYAPFFAIAAGGGMVAWGLVILGLASPPRPRPPLLVNAVAVTPGDAPPPDDWVHLFRRRRMSRAFALGVGSLSVYMLTIAVGTVLLVLEGAEDVGLLLFIALPVFSGIAIGIYAWREARSRRRLSTFGLPPTGLTVGESGITVLDPHATRFIPWESVTRVTATNARTRGGRSPVHPVVELGVGDETLTLQLTQHVASPAVVFTALAHAAEDADFRRELGTARAQAVLERWAADAVGAR